MTVGAQEVIVTISVVYTVLSAMAALAKRAAARTERRILIDLDGFGGVMEKSEGD